MDIDIFASGSSGNLYRVDDGRTQVLLECGITFARIQKALSFKLSKIDGCLITHEHMDHAKAVKELLLRGTDCYMSKGTAEALEVTEDPRTHIVKAKETFLIGTWTVLPFDTQHDAAEPLGFLLDNGTDRVLYATDTYYLKYKFPGCTAMLIECNHSYKIIDENVVSNRLHPVLAKRLMNSHFSLENLKEFFKVNDISKLREIHLIHLSDANSNEVQFQKEIAALTGKPVYIAAK
jgi:phosphoribosyl 1,2-cyclic phosphodiesterase